MINKGHKTFSTVFPRNQTEKKKSRGAQTAIAKMRTVIFLLPTGES